MHYNNLFLVKAESKANAIERVRGFLTIFDEDLEVEQHEEGYGYNPIGEWDWYQFGGRWMWSDLTEKNVDKIIKPGTNFYWNPYRDEKVKGKLWKLEFPDGTHVMARYGDNYAIKSWVNEHPERSEVIDATNPKFWEIIANIPELKKRNIQNWESSVRRWKEKEDKEMVEWCKKHLNKIKASERWTIDAHFWNIEGNCFGADKELVKEDAKHWFLVNVDLHS